MLRRTAEHAPPNAREGQLPRRRSSGWFCNSGQGDVLGRGSEGLTAEKSIDRPQGRYTTTCCDDDQRTAV